MSNRFEDLIQNALMASGLDLTKKAVDKYHTIDFLLLEQWRSLDERYIAATKSREK
jgi:hypothetical protein